MPDAGVCAGQSAGVGCLTLLYLNSKLSITSCGRRGAEKSGSLLHFMAVHAILMSARYLLCSGMNMCSGVNASDCTLFVSSKGLRCDKMFEMQQIWHLAEYQSVTE